MKLSPGKSVLWILLILFVGGALYGALGVLMGASFGASPNFPQAQAQWDVDFWGTVTVLCIVAAVVSGFLLRRKTFTKSPS
jgi:membrane protein DedA with SNARE-associated domain